MSSACRFAGSRWHKPLHGCMERGCRLAHPELAADHRIEADLDVRLAQARELWSTPFNLFGASLHLEQMVGQAKPYNEDARLKSCKLVVFLQLQF